MASIRNGIYVAILCCLVMGCQYRDSGNPLEQVRQEDCKKWFTYPWSPYGLEPCFRSSAQPFDTSKVKIMDDNQLMVVFLGQVRAHGPRKYDLASPEFQAVGDEANKRKLIQFGDIENYWTATYRPRFAGYFVGMHRAAAEYLRDDPKRISRSGNTERWDYYEAPNLIKVGNETRSQDYICVRNNFVSGVFLHRCKDGECSNTAKGEQC